jgi:hypothetical protein
LPGQRRLTGHFGPGASELAKKPRDLQRQPPASPWPGLRSFTPVGGDSEIFDPQWNGIDPKSDRGWKQGLGK